MRDGGERNNFVHELHHVCGPTTGCRYLHVAHYMRKSHHRWEVPYRYPSYTLSRKSVLEHIDMAVIPNLTFIIRPTLLPSSSPSHYHHPPLPHPCNPFCPTETTSHYCFLARGLAGEGTSWKGREVGAIACGRELLDIHEIVGGSPICD